MPKGMREFQVGRKWTKGISLLLIDEMAQAYDSSLDSEQIPWLLPTSDPTVSSMMAPSP